MGTHGNVTMAKNQSEGCTDCPNGYYQDLPGKTRCKTCSHGTFASNTSKCQDWATCAMGTYIVFNGNSSHDWPHAAIVVQVRFPAHPIKVSVPYVKPIPFKVVMGQGHCKNCSYGKYTKVLRLQLQSFHDEIADCFYPPKIVSLYPDNSTTQGGKHLILWKIFCVSTSIIQLKVGESCNAQIMNSTWIGTGPWRGLGKA